MVQSLVTSLMCIKDFTPGYFFGVTNNSIFNVTVIELKQFHLLPLLHCITKDLTPRYYIDCDTKISVFRHFYNKI